MGFRGTLGRSLPSRHSGAALRGAVYFGGGGSVGLTPPHAVQQQPLCQQHLPRAQRAAPAAVGAPRGAAQQREAPAVREPHEGAKIAAEALCVPCTLGRWRLCDAGPSDPPAPRNTPTPPPPVLTVRCQAVGAAQEVQGGRGVEVGAGPQRPTWEGGTPKNIKAPNVKQAPLPNSDP